MPRPRPTGVWSAAEAQAIAAAVKGKPATVTEESKPTTQASPLLFDLTSLQREANGKFGFSAKTTLALAQSLYERHKALTYPRTDSRALPEDYVPVAQQTFEMLAAQRHAPPGAVCPAGHRRGLCAAQQAHLRQQQGLGPLCHHPDHPGPIGPERGRTEALRPGRAPLHGGVLPQCRIPGHHAHQQGRSSTASRPRARCWSNPGWLAIYGKEAANEVEDAKEGDKGQPLVAVQPGEQPRTSDAQPKGLKTKPPARYSEATLLGAMESAGKQIDDEELRSAMQEKGLGTPATRAAIIEGLLTEKYTLREGRELIPTAKAFQLMTLLRGLQVDELCRADLTGEWEYKLSQMEKGALSRAAFMQEIAAMTERMVQEGQGIRPRHHSR